MYEAREDEIGQGQFWRALSARPVGATVVTTSWQGVPEGFLALSFAHVSADPPTVVVSVGKTTSALAAIRQSGAFAVNLLPATGETVARAVGGSVAKEARFDGLSHGTFVSSSPVLDIATTVWDSRVLQEIEQDATILLVARPSRNATRDGVRVF